MKSYIKGVITGLLIGAVIFAVPAIAENIDALFNYVRINVNGVDKMQWGDNITLSDGTETPSSILYNGTTYLPMRNLSETLGLKVYWNGDSNTVSVTGAQMNRKTAAEKADSCGNMWEYYTFEDTDGNNYLGVSDKERGYDRVYLMASGSIRVTEDGIYFLRLADDNANLYNNNAYLVKLSFDNDVNTQDGETIASPVSTAYTGLESGASISGAVFDGDYLYYAGYLQSNASPHGQISAWNYITGERIYFDTAARTRVTELQLVSSSDTEAVIEYTVMLPNNQTQEYRKTFDKTANSF